MSDAYDRPPGRLGRPPVCPPGVTLRIVALTDQGYSMREIAELFNAEGIPAPLGGSGGWYKSMVDRTTKTLCARDVIAQAGFKPGHESGTSPDPLHRPYSGWTLAGKFIARPCGHCRAREPRAYSGCQREYAAPLRSVVPDLTTSESKMARSGTSPLHSTTQNQLQDQYRRGTRKPPGTPNARFPGSPFNPLRPSPETSKPPSHVTGACAYGATQARDQ